jgi:hypothetical protein
MSRDHAANAVRGYVTISDPLSTTSSRGMLTLQAVEFQGRLRSDWLWKVLSALKSGLPLRARPRSSAITSRNQDLVYKTFFYGTSDGLAGCLRFAAWAVPIKQCVALSLPTFPVVSLRDPREGSGSKQIQPNPPRECCLSSCAAEIPESGFIDSL